MEADKGNCTVMNRLDYDAKMEALLSDSATYEKLKRDPTKATERRMNKLLLHLHSSMKPGGFLNIQCMI